MAGESRLAAGVHLGLIMGTEIPELNISGLRRFALTTAGLMAGLFGMVMPMHYHRHWPFWPWIVALVLVVWGVFFPARLRMLYLGWMKLALFLGRVNSLLLLTIVFICFISPIGVLMRLFGYDPLRLKHQTQVSSYRKVSVLPIHNHMEKPY
jgi:hypothetical protein